MNGFQSLSHSRWDCKYHVVFVPKGRKRSLYGKIRKFLKKAFHELARQKGCQIVEGHMSGNHVHMCISIPPKYAVSEVIGYLKGKSAIAVARQFAGRKKNFSGERFWSRGYAVSTVGFEENKIRDYIRHQECLDDEEHAGRF
jgi:putative transposase